MKKYMLKNLETKITSILLMALMLLTVAVPVVNATTLSQGVNVNVVYLPADANYHYTNYQDIQGATVNLYNTQGTLLGSQITGADGFASFTVPQGIQYYFTVSKSGYEQDWRAQNLGVPTVYQTHTATTTYAYDVFLKPTNAQSVTHVTPTTVNRNNEPFSIYVYDEQGNRVTNAQVKLNRLSDNANYNTEYTDSNGKATFYNSQFPTETAVYFKATKDDKTYESMNAVRFNKDADSTKGICQYTNTNTQLNCNVRSYALTKETTTTNPTAQTTVTNQNANDAIQQAFRDYMNSLRAEFRDSQYLTIEVQHDPNYDRANYLNYFKNAPTADKVVSNALVEIKTNTGALLYNGYTNANGQFKLRIAQLAPNIPHYISAKKDGITYNILESQNSNTYLEVRNGTLCTITRSSNFEGDVCGMSNLIILMDTTPNANPTTSPVNSNSNQYGAYSVYVFDYARLPGTIDNRHSVANVQVEMYNNNGKFIVGKFTNSNGVVNFDKQDFPSNEQKVYFKVFNNGITYENALGSAYYKQSTNQFCNYWTDIPEYCATSAAMSLYPKTVAQTNPSSVSSNNYFTVGVYDAGSGVGSKRNTVSNAIVTMYKLSDNSRVTSIYADGNGHAKFYASDFPQDNSAVYFKANKGTITYQNTEDKYQQKTFYSQNLKQFCYYWLQNNGQYTQNYCYDSAGENLYEWNNYESTNPSTVDSKTLTIKVLDSNNNLVQNANVYIFDHMPTSGDRYLKSGYTGVDGKFYYYNAPRGAAYYIYAVKNDGSTNSCYSSTNSPYCEATGFSAASTEVTLYQAGTCYKDSTGNCYRSPEAARGEVTTNRVTDVQPPTPPEETNTISDVTINLQYGWNLIGNAYGKLKLKSTTCQLPVKAYSYNINSGKYQDDTIYQNSILTQDAYWIKVNENCKLTFEVLTSKPTKTITGKQLYYGWNLISAPLNGENFNAGECQVQSGPWSFENGQWQKATYLQNGKAYFIKVNAPCRLGEYTYATTN